MSGNDFGWDNEPTEREWLEGLDPRTEQERRDESGNDAARLREDERRELLNGRRLAGENERGRIVRIAERILKDRLDAAEAAQRDGEAVVGRVRDILASPWLAAHDAEVADRARREALLEAAEYVDLIERLGGTISADLTDEERAVWEGSPLAHLWESYDPPNRPRPIVAAWLRARAERMDAESSRTQDAGRGEDS